jgi:uncharacterized protein (DUF433 family)
MPRGTAVIREGGVQDFRPEADIIKSRLCYTFSRVIRRSIEIVTDDLREIPTYTFTEAAHYLRVPVDTLRHWLVGYSYPTKPGRKSSKPLIEIAGKDPSLLSFHNLVEAHVLSALRRKHGVRMWKLRQALDYLQKEHPSSHPLTDYWFETDGIEVFVEVSRKLEIISQEGQLAVPELLRQHLSRIDRDDKKIAVRLYPYTSIPSAADTRLVVIDPRISYGRPVITGSGIPTSIIAERWQAGEALEKLMDDYGRTAQEIEEALRCELWRQAA